MLALARWIHEQRGAPYPAEQLPQQIQQTELALSCHPDQHVKLGWCHALKKQGRVCPGVAMQHVWGQGCPCCGWGHAEQRLPDVLDPVQPAQEQEKGFP